MTENDKKRSFSSVPILVVMLLLLLLLLLIGYPLSLGPVVWLVLNGYLPEYLESAIGVFYAPLGWLVEQFPWFRGLILKYLFWWNRG